MTRRMLQRICASTIIGLLGAAGIPHQGLAQEGKFEIGANYSYMWTGSYQFYEGEVIMEDNSSWGGVIDYAFRPDAMIELSYSYTSSNAHFQRYYNMGSTTPGLDDFSTPLTIQYFQAGSIYQMPKGKAQPFIGVNLGAVLFHPTGSVQQGVTVSDKWNFAMSVVGGVKVYLSDKFGIRLQGRLLLPMYFSGGSMYVGTGGAGLAVGAGIPVVQGDVGVGVFLQL